MSYSWPKTTSNGLYLQSSGWRDFQRLKIKPESVVYCFSDVDPENKSKIIWFSLLSVILCRSKSVQIFPSIRASQVIELHYSLRKGQQIQLFFQRHCITSPHPAPGVIIFQSRQIYLLCDFVFKYFISHRETPLFLTKNDVFFTYWP